MIESNAAAQQYFWIEAEHAIATNMQVRQNPFAPKNEAEAAKLSGGAWIGAYGPRRSPLFALYEVDVPEAGEYAFYTRKFWKHGPYRINVIKGDAVEVREDAALLDQVDIRPTVCANWTSAGTIKLKAGKNRFRIESTSNDGAISFDCFVITRERFAPRGILKPDQRMTSQEPGWFAWDPPTDRPGSPIDLRWMNEPVAGSEGRIIARDGRFLHEKSGKPVRFWGVNCPSEIVHLGERELNDLAALLASRGVNLVRYHDVFYARSGPNVGKIDDKLLADFQRAVAVFKKHGIYSTFSIYYPLWVNLDEAEGGWAGYKQQTPFALLFFDERLQKMHRGWWKELLTRPSPFTGVPLKDEPAVLSLEIQNEDSLFFWTFAPYRVIPAPTMELIERRFAKWLSARHGSADAALAHWKSEPVRGDEPAVGRVGICELWRIFSNRDERSKETLQFLYETQRDFYAQMRDYLQKDLGSISLVSASNWITANDEFLTPLERASNLAGDFIDRHAYYNGTHEGARAGYAIGDGDAYSDRSALRFEQEKPEQQGQNVWNPTFDTSFNDRPTMVSEIDWLEPNRFRAEAPFLCAAYGAQQDLDAYVFFAAAGPTWQTTTSKYALLTPAGLGQYPAAALIYRQGLVAEGPVFVDAKLNLKELLDLGGGLKGIDAKAYLVGRSRTEIGDGPTSRPSVDVAPFHDPAAKTVRSATGQLTLDYGRGVLSIDAPAAKAAVGFLGAIDGAAKLGAIHIESSMEYGAIAVVAMDGKPIASSEKLLVQVMSEQRNSGWKTGGTGKMKTLNSFGTAPLLVKELAGSVAFADGSRWTAQPLDQNGQPLGRPLAAASTLTLAPTTPYYLLTRAH